MKISFSILLMFLSTWVHCDTLDSLLSDVKKISNPDERIVKYHQLSQYYQLRDLEISAELARKGLLETLKNPNDAIRIDLLIFLGLTHAVDAQVAIFLDLFQEAEALARKSKNYKKLVEVHLERAQAYRLARVTDKCLEELHKAKKCSKKHNTSLSKNKYNVILANVYFLKKEYEEGFLFCKKEFPKEVYKNEKEIYNKNRFRIALSIYSWGWGSKDSSIIYLEKACEIAIKQNFPLQLNRILLNLGTFHTQLGNLEQARAYFEKSVPHMEEYGTLAEKIKTRASYTYLLHKLEEPKLAYQKRLELVKRLNSNHNIRQNPRLEEVEKHYDRKEKEEKYKYNIKEKELDQKTYNKVALISGILLFLSGLFFLIHRFVNQRKERLSQEKEFETLKLSMEKNRLDLKSRVKQISKLYGESDKISDMIALLINDNPENKSIKNVQIKLQSLHKLLMRQNDWEDFKPAFIKAFPDFERNLLNRFSDLTSSEVRICIYAKAGLTIKEIAHLKEISIEGVKTSYKRLKKKMNIGVELKLSEFVQEI